MQRLGIARRTRVGSMAADNGRPMCSEMFRMVLNDLDLQILWEILKTFVIFYLRSIESIHSWLARKRVGFITNSATVFCILAPFGGSSFAIS